MVYLCQKKCSKETKFQRLELCMNKRALHNLPPPKCFSFFLNILFLIKRKEKEKRKPSVNHDHDRPYLFLLLLTFWINSDMKISFKISFKCNILHYTEEIETVWKKVKFGSVYVQLILFSAFISY